MTLTDREWHLAKTDDELKITDFEIQLWRVFSAFLRWQQECEVAVNGTNLMGQDLSVLHIIRMKDRPKSISDIARLLNRDDTFNIQYSIRKLTKLGLIKNHKIAGNNSVVYEMTDEGVKNTDNLADARRKILIEMFVKHTDLDLEYITQALSRLRVIYDEAENAVFHHIPFNK